MKEERVFEPKKFQIIDSVDVGDIKRKPADAGIEISEIEIQKMMEKSVSEEAKEGVEFIDCFDGKIEDENLKLRLNKILSFDEGFARKQNYPYLAIQKIIAVIKNPTFIATVIYYFELLELGEKIKSKEIRLSNLELSEAVENFCEQSDDSIFNPLQANVIPDNSGFSIPGSSGVPHQLIISRSQIGSGGFASVNKAFSTKRMQMLAAKIIRPDKRSKTFRSIKDEAKLTDIAAHPNVIPVIDVVDISSEQDKIDHVHNLAMLMPFIDGRSLLDISRDRDFTMKQLTTWIRKIAQVLEDLRDNKEFPDKNIIVRDIKLGNIIIDTNGEPFLIDFGSSLLEAGNNQNIDNGKLAMTRGYASPEELSGSVVTKKSLTWNLAVVVYGLMVGPVFFDRLGSSNPKKMKNNFQEWGFAEWDSKLKENGVNVIELKELFLKAIDITESERPSPTKFASEFERIVEVK